MNLGRTFFSQLLEFVPTYPFQICVDRYQGNRYVKEFSCWDQFLCLVFAQLTYRESLRDIEACLIWVSGGKFLATRWPTPTRCATGAFTATLPKC